MNDIIKIVGNNELIELLREMRLKYISSILGTTNAFNNIEITLFNYRDLFSLFWLTWLIIFSVAKVSIFYISIIILTTNNTRYSYYYLLLFMILIELAMNQKYIGRGNSLINTHIYNETSVEHKLLSKLDILDRTAVYWPNKGVSKKFIYKSDTFPFPQPHKFYPLLGNFQLPYLVPSYSSYVSIIQSNLAEFHKNISGNIDNIPYPRALDSQIFIYDINNELIDYAGIKYIFSPIIINDNKYKLITKGNYYYIYENTKAHRKFDFVSDSLVSKNSEGISYNVTESNIANNNINFNIENIYYGYDDISFEIESSENGFVIIKDTYSKGWYANVNGTPSDIFQINNIFRGIHINKGINTVTLMYSPHYYYYSIIIFTIGLILLLLIYIINRFRYRE